MKASGYGKDLSIHSLEDYTVPRHIMLKISGAERSPLAGSLQLRMRDRKTDPAAS